VKKILITGANSYIGTSLECYLRQWPERYHVDTIDMIDGSWRNAMFKGYDAVFHVAGIAHQKETKENVHLHYTINRDLAVETAKKSKADHVGQFIYLSSMSVYGTDSGIISKETIPKPISNYGKAKKQAEDQIKDMETQDFKVAILRPPLVYGKGCKGNYTRLSKLAVKTPVFPDINNQRSMLYIDNLSEFVRHLIDTGSAGLFFPQNPEYVRTSQLVQLIAQAHGKNIRLTKFFNLPIKLLRINEVKKVFGSLVYDKAMSQNEQVSLLVDLAESIRKTEI
jgi:nucleoside-diphosphate-sugar epimerase